MKWFRNILKGATLTTAMFIFQACYGTPQGLYGERGLAPMSFSLVSDSTGEPLEGIKVLSSAYGEQATEIGVTDAWGKCKVEIPYMLDVEGPALKFLDPEGNYMAKDTTLADLREREILIELVPAE